MARFEDTELLCPSKKVGINDAEFWLYITLCILCDMHLVGSSPTVYVCVGIIAFLLWELQDFTDIHQSTGSLTVATKGIQLLY